MTNHIVSAFDAELGELRRGIAEMGGIAEKMLSDATSALVRDHAALARAVIAADPQLDQLQRTIEEGAITTIARRQPLAVDLREVIAALRIAGDLERAGDLAKNIAKRVIATTGQSQPKRAVMGVQRMSDLALRQDRSEEALGWALEIGDGGPGARPRRSRTRERPTDAARIDGPRA